ncbi:beta-1,3-galactosyltransferase 1-like [Octopus sinensis]|uniref:Hexosyltransferase n=1 Tax=Octopus sinensis TaxID=2607531 RepID=A0A6P7SKS0_9MOLL|nr:beta-1,3-galactosyltransferase 1-like [Octopus sinensis]
MNSVLVYNLAFLPVFLSIFLPNNLFGPTIVFAHTNTDDDTDAVPLDTFVTSRPRDPRSAVPEKFYNAPQNCNPHPYMYLINPSTLCVHKDEVFLLILVRTIFSQFERRMAIRETWGDKKNFRNVSVVVAFLFGRDQDLHLQPSIHRESEIYKDIIQEDFIDSYDNLTLKTVMAWKWARLYCLHATFVMVMNDEMFVDIFKLIPYLRQISLKSEYVDHFALCYYFPCCDLVYRRGKYAAANYSSTAYPEYCSGVAYAASMKVINQLYLMSIDTPMFMPDDAWIGVLAEKLRLKFIDTDYVFEGISVKNGILKKFMNPDYLGSATMIAVLDYVFPNKEAVIIRHLWRLVLDHHRKSFLRNQVAVKKMNLNTDWEILEANNVFYLVAYMMFVDVFVVGIILCLLFYRRKIKLGCKASYQCLNY